MSKEPLSTSTPQLPESLTNRLLDSSILDNENGEDTQGDEIKINKPALILTAKLLGVFVAAIVSRAALEAECDFTLNTSQPDTDEEDDENDDNDGDFVCTKPQSSRSEKEKETEDEFNEFDANKFDDIGNDEPGTYDSGTIEAHDSISQIEEKQRAKRKKEEAKGKKEKRKAKQKEMNRKRESEGAAGVKIVKIREAHIKSVAAEILMDFS